MPVQVRPRALRNRTLPATIAHSFRHSHYEIAVICAHWRPMAHIMKRSPVGVRSGVPSSAIGGIRQAGPQPALFRTARGADRLTDRACHAARPGSSARKLSDAKGLYLLVQPTGAKLWRLKYRHAEKERTYAIGAYPELSLAEARAER